MERDFLSLFRSTEFDWSNYRIRLGEYWIPTEVSLHGGEILSRVQVINSIIIKDTPLTPHLSWDINPELDAAQHRDILNILTEYSDVFAVDPKNPRLTRLTEHVIETGGSRYVKAKYNRVDPLTQQEIDRLVDQMLKNGIIRKSNSP